ncbi:MAG: hypothetical protein ABWY25_02730 [Paenisporosarcina sp.]
MAYSDQALLSQDNDFIFRVAACAAVEIELVDKQPIQWTNENIWFIAAAPGFADQYASALAANIIRPGNDQSVISDNEILAAVQARETQLQP